MKVRMLSSLPVCPDGIQTIFLRRGEKYDLSDSLAMTLIGQGNAEQDKDMGGAPEVKASEPEMPWGREGSANEEKPRKEKRRKRRG